ncbi:hypothetical protein HUT19_15095 [Streptomyces sp. NA02950]|uniref:hypothetical protein n=1 Tax=Streptomyces sp. NA02950 TaxID=2742137 RepID=UPI0015928678|nr:hypothetical protein [Streptomyces sp. NA02950]QKV92919.1 hypothetical protein HUT19_15095 [Streptomyces sp. NA02950]
MSDFAGTPNGAPTARLPIGPAVGEVAHEAYAFACMKCGHGWERSYDIEHHVDGEGRPFVVYFTDGTRVRSPLTSPDCVNCGAHLVRIMRAGQVSSALEGARRGRRTASGTSHSGASGASAAETGDAAEGEEGAGSRKHHWHLSDLLHPFQHHRT